MTRSLSEVLGVAAMLRDGISQAEASRRTGIPRSTIRYWVCQGTTTTGERRRAAEIGSSHERCPPLDALPEAAYSYLLGLYLGDGCISTHPRGVYRLRIVLDLRYPDIIGECRVAMAVVLPNRVGEVLKTGCVEVGSYSKHWPCLFPQHGSGPKHLRSIVLRPWQRRIALDTYPNLLLRGLVHSDGWRGMNRVGRGYEYPRYQFSSRSDDIRSVFKEACDKVGIDCKPSNRWMLAVSRRADVAAMDVLVGRKT